MQTVIIQKQKRGKGIGRWPAYVLGEDEHGLWLFCPAGTPYRSWNMQGELLWSGEVGQGDRVAGIAVVHLIPHQAWWIASWWDDAAGRRISIDICTSPALVNGVWVYDDLELDLQAFHNGDVVIEDEDEFIAAREAGEIAVDEAKAAHAATEKLDHLLHCRKEPFGLTGWANLDYALNLMLPVQLII